MSNVELLPTEQRAELPAATLAPRNLAEAMEFSKIVSQSAIVPKDYQGKPANVLVAVQWGMELGLAPMQAMQNIAVINGRPSIWGDAMLAICQGHSSFEDISEDDDGEMATCTVKRRGRSPVTKTFSMADAKTAGLAGKSGPWSQYPARMRQMRARSFALRDAFADVLKGIQSAEEVGDTPEKDMGQAERVDPPKATSRSQSAKEKARANVKKDNPELLQSFLAAIEGAKDKAELDQAVADIDALSDHDKSIARTAYVNRLGEIKVAAADKNTREIPEETGTAFED